MKYKDFFGYKISRLGVGTVQFGMNYGINNKTGQTPIRDIDAIFAKCLEYGITLLDTSRLYGSSEELIAKSIDRLGAKGKFFITTKLDLPRNWETMSEKDVLRCARQSLEKSLRLLQVESIPLYLLHTERYLRFSALWDFILKNIEKGIIQHAGVSIETGPEGAQFCLTLPKLEALQIPFNILDARWDTSGFFDQMQLHKILLISRSALLQGLLLMSASELPGNLKYAAKYLEGLDKIASQEGIDRKSLCLRYVFSQQRIDTTILGLDTAAQFDENYEIYNRGALDEKIFERIKGEFKDVPVHCVNPALWNNPIGLIKIEQKMISTTSED